MGQRGKSSKNVFFGQERKSSLNRKFLGGIFLGHPGPRRRDIPDKNFMLLGHPGPRCGDIPDRKLYASGLFLLF